MRGWDGEARLLKVVEKERYGAGLGAGSRGYAGPETFGFLIVFSGLDEYSKATRFVRIDAKMKMTSTNVAQFGGSRGAESSKSD